MPSVQRHFLELHAESLPECRRPARAIAPGRESTPQGTHPLSAGAHVLRCRFSQLGPGLAGTATAREDAGVMDDIDPLALVLVVEHSKTSQGEPVAGAEDIFDAAAAGVDEILLSEDRAFRERLDAWNSERIRKIVKRARNKAWSDILALDLPHITVESGDARVAVFAPLRPSEYPRPLANAQVTGLEAPHRRDPSPGALRVHMDPALHMSTGKAVAQLGHAVQLFGRERADVASRWRQQGRHVEVVLGVPDEPLAVVVRDAGFTEVPPNSLTAAITEAEIPKLYLWRQ